MPKKNFWFKRKLYGWGWTPVTWQGWAITATFILTNVLNAYLINPYVKSDWEFFSFATPFMIISTGILLWVCYIYGEKPMWQWGKRK